MRNSKNEYIAELSKSIIDSIELSKVDAESILLKCKRLASYIDDYETNEWLQYELEGYNEDLDNWKKFIDKTNRWTNLERTKALKLPLKKIETIIEDNKTKIKSIRISDPNDEYEAIAVCAVLKNLNSSVEQYAGIKDRIIHLLHEFATKIYYEFDSDVKLFSKQEVQSSGNQKRSVIKELIIQNKIKDAIQMTSKFTNDPSIHNETILLLSQYNSLTQKERLGTLSQEQISIGNNKIKATLLNLVDEV